MVISYRTLNYKDLAEVRGFLRVLYAICAEGDAYYFDKSDEFIDRAVIKARREENPRNTFAGLAEERGKLVGVHVVRRQEEGPRVYAHVSGLWVAESCRRRGVARELKAMGERWARGIGAEFMNTHVLVENEAMLALNRGLGYTAYRINLRKRL